MKVLRKKKNLQGDRGNLVSVPRLGDCSEGVILSACANECVSTCLCADSG